MKTESIGRELHCPWCSSTSRWGVRVCLGCKADIAYGITWREASGMIKLGLVVGLGLAFYFLISGQVDRTAWKADPGILAGLAVGLPLLLTFLRAWWLRGRPRFFRRTAF